MRSCALSVSLLTFCLFSTFVNAFDATANDNVAVYWGQGSGQAPLSSVCAETGIDIVILSFVTESPDQTGNAYPASDFGNACGGYFTDANGNPTQLEGPCPLIGDGIDVCHNNGKKVLLSLGGGAASGFYIASTSSADSFATFLWSAFGPYDSTSPVPRPFGNSSVDGFDFDIESAQADIPSGQAIDGNYGELANELRTLYAGQEYYLSAAPQCVIPDAHLASALETATFDWIFVQFYNTDFCSARAHIDHTFGEADNGNQPTDISFDAWVTWAATNSPSSMIYCGLPAAPGAANADYYLDPTDANTVITDLMCENSKWGGIMLWDASFSDANIVDGVTYAQEMKNFMLAQTCAVGGTGGTSSSTTAATTSTTLSTTLTTTTTTSSSSSSLTTTTTDVSSTSTSTLSTSTSTTSSSSSGSSSSSSSTSTGTASSSSATTSSTTISLASSSSSSTPSSSSTSSSLSTTTTAYSSIVGAVTTTSSSTTTSSTTSSPSSSSSTTTTVYSSIVGAVTTSSSSSTRSSTTSSLSSYSSPTTTWDSLWPPASSSLTTSSTTTPAGSPVGPASTTTSAGGLPWGGTTTITLTTTITYTDICSTGFTVVPWQTVSTITSVIGATPTTTPAGGCPDGFTTTVTVCTVCGPAPTTCTLTKPIGAPPSPPPVQTLTVSPIPAPPAETTPAAPTIPAPPVETTPATWTIPAPPVETTPAAPTNIIPAPSGGQPYTWGTSIASASVPSKVSIVVVSSAKAVSTASINWATFKPTATALTAGIGPQTQAAAASASTLSYNPASVYIPSTSSSVWSTTAAASAPSGSPSVYLPGNATPFVGVGSSLSPQNVGITVILAIVALFI